MAGTGTSWVLAAAVVSLALALPSPGAAQATLSSARAALEEARFSDADRLFSEAADASEGLSRQALVELLRGRALARGALRDGAGARADLAALLSLDPGASLGAEAPPSLQALFQEARASSGGALALEVQAGAVEGGFEVVTSVRNDPGRLVREVRVYDLDAPAASLRGTRVRVEREGELRFVVEVVGWGGAVLATEGTPEAPRIVGRGLGGGGGGGAGGGDATGLIVGLAVGGAVLAVAVIVLAVLLAPSGRTQPGRPMELTP